MFWVAALTEDQIVNWLEQSTDTSWDASLANRTELQTNLLQKLSITAPERALSFALEKVLRKRNLMVRVVFEAWVNNDLHSAIERAKELREQDFYTYTVVTSILGSRSDLPLDRLREIATDLGDERYAFSSYFRTLTDKKIDNPRETWYEIVNLVSRENVIDFASDPLRRVAGAWIEEQSLEVLDEMMSSISVDTNYSSIISRIFSGISSDYPEEVFDYIMSNLGDRATEIIKSSEISYNWARKDAKGMLAKVKTLPASGFRRDLMRDAVRRWAENSPRQVLEQLALLPYQQRVYASRRAMVAFARTSPTEAAQFVLQVTDVAMQEQLAGKLIQQWTAKDADAAKDWVLSLSTNEPLRDSLIRPLSWYLVRTDPRGAFELALHQPIANGHEVSILHRIANQDVQLALELLPQVREGDKTNAFITVGSALVQLRDTEQALSLANQLNEAEQTEFYQGIAMNWAWHDPKGLLRAVEDFPTASKSRIAVAITVANLVSPTYSDEEIVGLEKHISEKDKELLKQAQEIDLSNPSNEDLEIIDQLHLW